VNNYKSAKYERGVPLFRPFVFKHATPDGKGPMISSSKQAKQFLESKGLVSDTFS